MVGVGANSVDYVNRLPSEEPLASGAKLRIREQAIHCGGQVATALAACAALGLRTRYVGAIGSDDNGRRIQEELSRRHIDASRAIVRQAPNPSAVILVDDESGERTVLWHRDARLSLQPGELSPEWITTARLVHVDDVDQPAAIAAARVGRAAGLPVTSDIDRVTDLTRELIAAVSVPMFAEHVPAELTGRPDPERALRRLREQHQGVLIVTLGARGAVALDGDRFLHAPGFPVRAVDTTGSGDVFRGGFIFATLRGWNLDTALTFANAAAAVSCTRPGAMDGVPSLQEIEQLVASARA